MLLKNAKIRPTIGLLISHIDGAYQIRFWQGLMRFCRRNDCDLIVYASRLWRGQAGSFRDQEAVYRLANASRIDALCIDTSAFRNQDDLSAYLQSSPELRSIPIIYSSIGGSENLRVMPKNRNGIRQAMAHLIDVHGCDQLAYVGGPADIEDAQERLAAFLEYMAERGLPIHPEWVIEATFDTPSGRDATQKILDSPPGRPQAIVFANDLMALGGLEYLKSRNIDVPNQVRVTGFDDDELSHHTAPTLSTVAQPIEAKAWVAGKSLLDAVNGLPLRHPPEIGVKFLPRGSCGCGDKPPIHFYGRPNNAEKVLLNSKIAITGISQVTEFLGSVLSLNDLSTQLGRLIRALGIGPTFISLHDEATVGELPTKFSFLVSAVDGEGKQLIDPENPRRFLSEQIVPSNLQANKERTEYFIQALYKAEKHFGFLTTTITDTNPAVYVAMRDHISEVLFNIQYVDALAESQQALKQTLERAMESERQFRELTQSLPAFIMETGVRGSIKYLNDLAKTLLELSDQDIAGGLNVTEFLEPGQADFSQLVAAVPEFLGYKDVRMVSRSGRKLSLLLRSVELEAKTSRRNWSGFDYKPILTALTLPNQAMIDRYGLTKRESQILALELRGFMAKEIAAELSISLSTVRGHLGLIYRKLEVGSRDQLFKMFGQQIITEYGYESLVFWLLSDILRR